MTTRDAAEESASKAQASAHVGHRARLRKRLLDSGALSLADHELLELVLFAAYPRGDTKPLAKRLLKKFNGYNAVIRAEIAELKEVEGVGDAAVAALKAVEAASLKLLENDLRELPILRNWQAVHAYTRARLGFNKVESLWVLYLNTKNRLISAEEVQRGTLNQTAIYPRELVRKALAHHAAAIIMVHNHPSGDVTPSKEDIELTRAVQEALKVVSIGLVDHLIVGPHEAVSSLKNLGVI
ncbi:MAG: RadC family protein [Holosporales bacterium]|jgi:DNA repair protein RadC